MLEIIYKEIAVGAKESSTYSAINYQQKQDPALLKYEQNDITYGSITETNHTILHSKRTPIASDLSRVGLWSDKQCLIDTQLLMTLDISLSEIVDIRGITLTYDNLLNVFPQQVIIKFYLNDSVIFEKEFENDNVIQRLEDDNLQPFNRFEVKFYDLNIKQHFLKIKHILFGLEEIIPNRDIKATVKLVQEIDDTNQKISIDELDLTFLARKDYRFKTYQPLQVSDQRGLRAYLFLDKIKWNSYDIVSLEACDYVNILDKYNFLGGFFENACAMEVLTQLFDTANVPWKIDDYFAGATISGHLEIMTCREALNKICNAINATIVTADLDYVYIKKLSTDIVKEIPKNHIFSGAKSNNNKIKITAIEITEYTYYETNITKELYFSEQEQEEVFIEFSDATYNLEIKNGEILESNANYAIINAFENCSLTGKEYDYTKTVKAWRDTQKLVTDVDNIEKISRNTLISTNNSEEILEMYKDTLLLTETLNVTFDMENLKIGDVILIDIGLKTKYKARIIEATYKLYGTRNIGTCKLKVLEEIAK
ncbi:MAG: hypothetical protein ATN36_06625 [Epulopiscium sp. Nele67-Bin005]|nr:MAG: hypothetical protein ATN36_06625 [Epulopiscium sp. Nele67-Bin005]